MGSLVSSHERPNQGANQRPNQRAIQRANRPRYESVSYTEGAPTDKRWFHASITHREAEGRLRESGSDDHDGPDGRSDGYGSYLVYTDPSRDGSYVLLVLYRGKVYRWKIHRRGRDGLYVLGDDIEGGKGYRSVSKLIKNHRGITGKPITTGDGHHIKLSRSYAYMY